MKTVQLILNEEDRVYPNICFIRDFNLDCKYINKAEYFDLQKQKNKIFESKEWDKMKKFSNDYELIHIPNKRSKSDSVAFYQPLSRSYFKMIEIIKDFNLIDNSKIGKSFISSHLAEGPGGFMEACYNISHKSNYEFYSHYGITLFSTNKDIPGWNKAQEFIYNNNDIKICYGKDKTGNLYKSENILNFIDNVGRSNSELVTADGGFDFSIDFNKQELLSYRLILCEIITALGIQKIGGSFVCKFFDLYTIATIKLLFLLNSFYDEVYITKPLTSRPANSEKYIVCKKFKGIDFNYVKELINVVGLWDKNSDHILINDIFDIVIPSYYIKQIKNYNKINYKLQINTINNTLSLMAKSKSLTILNNIIEKQVLKAKEWCEEYKEKVNQRSNFVIRFTKLVT